jgi:hypothetical protein
MTAGRSVENHGEAANMLPPQRRRRSRNARQRIFCHNFAPGSAVILGGQVGLRAAGAPWWIFGLLSMLGLAAACLQIVFPQDSPDKVAWWSGHWMARRRCQCQAEHPLTKPDESTPRPYRVTDHDHGPTPAGV